MYTYTATHFSTPQHSASHCNALQQNAANIMSLCALYVQTCMCMHTYLHAYIYTVTHCSTLQHTATHFNTLQHTATHCRTLPHTAPRRHPQYKLCISTHAVAHTVFDMNICVYMVCSKHRASGTCLCLMYLSFYVPKVSHFVS